MLVKKRTGIICMTLALLFVLVSGVLAEGEWTPDGDNLYNTNTGKVGIGTRNPGGKLHVAGDIISGNTSTGVGTISIYDTGNNHWYTQGVGPNSFLTDLAGTSAVGNWEVRDLNVSFNGGNVGIGTTNPGAKLVVRGPNTGSGLLRIHNTGPSAGDVNGIDFYHYIDEGIVTNPKAYIRDEVLFNWGTKLHFGTSDNTGSTVVANTKMTIDDRGYVGIGTTGPGQTLDIEGNLELNGSLIGGVSSARAYYNLLASRWGRSRTGALVIQTNVPQDDHTMTQTKVVLKSKYSSGSTSCEYLISGYWSTETNGGFSGRGYRADCSDIQRIRFMRNSGNGKVAIVIGEATTTWSHPMVAVPEFLAHYGIASDDYASGWTASIANDLSGYINSDDVGNTSPIHETSTRVGIGTTNPQSKLAVNGTITAKEIKVESGWSDFVFDEDYDLASLEEVESFIHDNKHLPDIPSAKQVEHQGLAVSEMLAKQMQKIEEMTLYLIKINKENNLLKETVAYQDKQLASLKELRVRIEELEQRK